MTDLETAIAAANRWTEHAAPIIRAYLAMEDVGFFSKDWVGADDEQRAADKAGDKAASAIAFMKKQSYDEARGYCEKAQSELYDMLDGIRDMYRADNSLSYVSTMTDQQEDALIQFNDALDAAMITVEVAVNLVRKEL